MILVRVIAVLILIFGLATSFVGISGLSMVETSIRIMEEMRNAGSTRLNGIDLSSMRIVLYLTSGLSALIGISSVISGIGILFKKNWARLLWLGTIIVTVVWMAYSLAMTFINGVANAEGVLEYLVIEAVLVAFFIFFSREKIRVQFSAE